MDIVACCDSNYIMPTGVMFLSVCKNNKETPLHFHLIIDESVTDTETKSLNELVANENSQNTISFYRIDSNFLSNYPSIGKFASYISKASYYRLFIANILPKEINKIIYLDCDIIVRHNLSGLLEQNINNRAIGCVIDIFDADISIYNRLQYPLQKGYFNAGVLLINLEYWRVENLAARFQLFINNKQDIIRSHDQDVLNCTLVDEKVELPLTYNFQSGFAFVKEQLHIDYWKYKDELEQTISDPAIIHFTDFPKPWYTDCKNPYKEEFIKYYIMSPWAKIPLKKSDKTLKQYFALFLRERGVLSRIPNYYRSVKLK